MKFSLTSYLESLILLIISHLVFSVLLQVILYFFNFSINLYVLLFSLIPYLLFENILFTKKNMYKRVTFSILVYAFLIVICLYYYSHFIDHSFDGNMYHGEVMVQLIYGWNPIFNSNIYLDTYGMVWGNLYPKFSWIIGSLFMSLSSVSSAGMLLNALIAILATIKTYIFSKKYLNTYLSVTAALIVFMNPIFIEQIHTLYVDSTIANFMVLLIIYNFELMTEYSIKDQVLVILISIALINLKFSSFAFAGFIDLSTFIYFLIKNRILAIKVFISGIIILILGVLIIGYSPYIVNVIENRNIFFPLMGKDKWDVVSSLILEPLLKLRSYERFFYSITNGEYLNSLVNYDSWGYMLYDQRIGGFGFNYAKLLAIFSFSFLLFSIKVKFKFRLGSSLLFILFLISIIANYRNIWWARYAPHLWLLVIVIVYLLNSIINKKWIKNLITSLILFLVLQQSFDIYKLTLERDLFVTKQATDVYDFYLNQDEINLYINNGNANQFIVYEEYKQKEYGLNINISFDAPIIENKCYPLEVYSICYFND